LENIILSVAQGPLRKLWYKKLTKFLWEQGYEHSPTDPFIMRRIVDDEIFLLVISVDDILISQLKKK